MASLPVTKVLSAALLLTGAIQCLKTPPDVEELIHRVQENLSAAAAHPKFRRADATHTQPDPNPTRNGSATNANRPNTAERLTNHFELIHFRPRESCSRVLRNDKIFAFYCPTPVMSQYPGGWVCITTDQLCNGIPDCPNGEDEDPTDCMYFLAIQNQNVQLRRIIISHYEQFHQVMKKSEFAAEVIDDQQV